jgi:hypothetical protein
LGAVLLLAASAASAADLLTFNTKAQVTVDANGVPTEVVVPAELPAPVAQFVRNQVLQWRFQAPEHDGQRHGGQTWVMLGACAAPTAQGYQLAIDYKGTGPGVRNVDGMLPPPAYPPRAARQGFGTGARVHYVVETDGSTTLEKIEYPKPGPAPHLFDDTLRAWVGALRYDPESIDGKPVRTRMSVPVDFAMVVEIPRGPASSSKAECQTAMKKEDPRRAVALDSPFRRIDIPG